jgi:hypothetical protein
MDTRTGLDVVEQRITCTYRELNPDRPARSLLQYWLSYSHSYCKHVNDYYCLQFTVTNTYTLGFFVFTSRTLATDLNTVNTREVFSSPADFQISTELFAISCQSFSTAVSRDSLNYISAGLGSSLYSLGADPTENTISIVIAQKYLDYCLLIRFLGSNALFLLALISGVA